MGYDDRVAAEEARMPNPRRVVRKSVRVCRRLGMSEHQAVHVIIQCAVYALNRVDTVPGARPRWLDAVVLEALRRHAGYAGNDCQAMSGLGTEKGRDA